MNFPITYIDYHQISQMKPMSLNFSFFESFIIQYETRLKQQASLLNLNANLINKTKNDSIDNQSIFDLSKQEPGDFRFKEHCNNEANFPNFERHIKHKAHENKHYQMSYFGDFNFDNKKDSSQYLNLEEFPNKTSNSQIIIAKESSELDDLNKLKVEENNQLASILGFLNDSKSEKNTNIPNQLAQKNFEIYKNSNIKNLMNLNKPNLSNINTSNNIYSSSNKNTESKLSNDNINIILANSFTDQKEKSFNNKKFNNIIINNQSNIEALRIGENQRTSELTNFLLGKKLNRFSPKIFDTKIESTDNDTDEIKKQTKVIYKNRKFVFTHKYNKAIEDSFKKSEKRFFLTSTKSNLYNTNFNHNRNNKNENKSNFRKSELQSFENFNKENFYLNYKKENNSNLFVKVPFAISKVEKKLLLINKNSHLKENNISHSESHFQTSISNELNYLCLPTKHDVNNNFNENINDNIIKIKVFFDQKEKLNNNSKIPNQQHLINNSNCQINLIKKNYFNNYENSQNNKINSINKIIKNTNNTNVSLELNSYNNKNNCFNENDFNKFFIIISEDEKNKIEHMQTTKILKKKKRLILGKCLKSRFRGVWKKGTQWQVVIMIKKLKRFVGTFDSEDLAAKAYDKVAIQLRKSKAKTNFLYTESEISHILHEKPLLSKNIC